MKKLAIFLFTVVLFAISTNTKGQASVCNAYFDGNSCDVSTLGNCAVMCFPNKK